MNLIAFSLSGCPCEIAVLSFLNHYITKKTVYQKERYREINNKNSIMLSIPYTLVPGALHRDI